MASCFANYKSFSREAGISLIEALIGIAVASFLALAVAQHIANTAQSQEVIKNKSELEDLRQMVRNNLSCELTLERAHNLCKNSGNIAIEALTASGKSLFSPSQAKVGDKYSMRAICGSSIGADTIRLEYRRSGSTKWSPLNPGYDIQCNAGSVENFSCTGKEAVLDASATFTFPRHTIRSFVNSISSLTKIPDDSTGRSGEAFAGAAEAKAICCLAGYAKGTIVSTSSYKSCDDNTMALWKDNAKDWQIIGACSANKYIGSVSCKGSLEGGWGRRLKAASFVP